MSLQKEFIPYELAVKLKELGFDEECFGMYTEDKDFPHIVYGDVLYSKVTMHFLKEECLAPLWQQAFDWFREKGFESGVSEIYNSSKTYNFHINYSWGYFEGTYEEARQACLQKLIELVKQ